MWQLYEVRSRVEGELTDHVNELIQLNDQNVEDQENLENTWAYERARDVKQDRYITKLDSAVRDFKDKLFQVKITSHEHLHSPQVLQGQALAGKQHLARTLA